jgi:aspartate/methionine/tyrosine aminotransferase
MTGWRVGYAAGPASVIDAMGRIQGHMTSNPTSFAMVGAVAALAKAAPQVRAMLAEFESRRDLLVAGLNRLPGFHCPLPAGAFYAFPNISGTGRSARELQDKLLAEAGVALVAGTSFGDMGEGYIRFSYANSIENIERAIDRIDRFLAS